jgi:hypothetical protein
VLVLAAHRAAALHQDHAALQATTQGYQGLVQALAAARRAVPPPVSPLAMARERTVERDLSAGWSIVFPAIERATHAVYAAAQATSTTAAGSPSHVLDILSIEASGDTGRVYLVGEVAQLATLERWRDALAAHGLNAPQVRSLQRISTNHGHATRFQLDARMPSLVSRPTVVGPSAALPIEEPPGRITARPSALPAPMGATSLGPDTSVDRASTMPASVSVRRSAPRVGTTP